MTVRMEEGLGKVNFVPKKGFFPAQEIWRGRKGEKADTVGRVSIRGGAWEAIERFKGGR